jgi:hypothetical protein
MSADFDPQRHPHRRNFDLPCELNLEQATLERALKLNVKFKVELI